MLCKGIKVLPWPLNFPDPNSIEKLLGIIAMYVYANGRCQILTKEDLMAEIVRCWEKITVGTINALLDSMPDQCTDLLLERGGKIDY